MPPESAANATIQMPRTADIELIVSACTRERPRLVPRWLWWRLVRWFVGAEVSEAPHEREFYDVRNGRVVFATRFSKDLQFRGRGLRMTVPGASGSRWEVVYLNLRGERHAKIITDETFCRCFRPRNREAELYLQEKI